jgi:hypothetical protein
LVGCSTGRSAGFAPFNILSRYRAAEEIWKILSTLATIPDGGVVAVSYS